MTYGDLQNLVQTLNTGSTNPDYLGKITKLVLGKISRRRLKSRVKLASISTGGSFSLDLRTLLPDFLDFKIDASSGKPTCVYYYEGSYPFFFEMSDNSKFAEHTEGGYATLVGSTLKFSMPIGESAPSTIYFPYYSKYLVLDSDGTTEKEEPSDNNDSFLLPSEYDDLLVDGDLLYLSRREKEDSEYTKNVQEWEKRLNEIVYYQ